MGEVVSVTLLDGIALYQNRSHVIQVGTSDFIISSEEHNFRKFLDDMPKEWLGKLVTNALGKHSAGKKRRVFWFGFWEQKESEKPRSIEKSRVELSQMLLDALLFGLWLATDYYVEYGPTLFSYSEADSTFPLLYIHRHALFNSRGQRDSLVLNAGLLRKATSNMNWYLALNKRQSRRNADGSKISRHARVIHLLYSARAEYILDARIASYMTVLESLLVRRSDSEIRYRVSERASLLAGRTDRHRQEIFNDVKAAYKIRSDFIHGQKLTVSSEELMRLSSACDAVIRRLLSLRLENMQYPILTDDNISADEFDNYFIRKVLGGSKSRA